MYFRKLSYLNLELELDFCYLNLLINKNVKYAKNALNRFNIAEQNSVMPAMVIYLAFSISVEIRSNSKYYPKIWPIPLK